MNIAQPNNYFNPKVLMIDVAYLITILPRLVPESLSSSKRAEELRKFSEFVEELDHGMNRGRAAGGQKEYPFWAMATELERPVSTYLANDTWQTPYLDWVIVNCYLKMEAVSFIRDMNARYKIELNPAKWLQNPLWIKRDEMKVLFSPFKGYYIDGDRAYGPYPKKVLPIVEGLYTIARHSDQPSYSPTALLKDIDDAMKKDCSVSVFARAILERLKGQGIQILTFPSNAKGPLYLERINLQGAQRGP